MCFGLQRPLDFATEEPQKSFWGVYIIGRDPFRWKTDYSRTWCQWDALQIHSDINLCEQQPITACGGAQKKCALSLLSVTSNTLDWWCTRYQLSNGWEVHSLWQRRNTACQGDNWKISEKLKTFAGFSLAKCCLIIIRHSSVYRLHLQFSSGSLFHSFPRLAFCFYDKFLSIWDTDSLMRNLEGMDLRGLKKTLRDKEDSNFKKKGWAKVHNTAQEQSKQHYFFPFFFWRLADRLTLCDTLRDLQCAISYYSSEPGWTAIKMNCISLFHKTNAPIRI